MNIEKGTKYYHWYYGPMTVLGVENHCLLLSIDNPEGIFDSLDRNKKEKKFPLENAYQWLFDKPYQVHSSKFIEISRKHNLYKPENLIIFYQEEKRKLLTELEEKKKLMMMLDGEWKEHNASCETLSTKILYENGIINKQTNHLIKIKQDKENLQGEIEKIESEITTIKSPKELKFAIEKKAFLQNNNKQLDQEVSGIRTIINSSSKLEEVFMNEKKEIKKELENTEKKISAIKIIISGLTSNITVIDKAIINLKE